MDNCKSYTKDLLITFKDHKSKGKMCFKNPNQERVTKIRVDGCLITAGKKCDYLLINKNGLEHFIELKGKDINKACLQLEATILEISNTNKEKKSFIVSSACPPAINGKIQIWKLNFKKKYNSSLIIKNMHIEHDLSCV